MGKGKEVSFASVNFPTHRIRHMGFRLQITEIHSDLDHADSTFKMVKALNGMPGAVSFESKNFDGHFLRHRAFEGWVERGDGSPVFAGDASFMVRPGLTGTPGAISFESCNFPGHFIRHEGFMLFVRPRAMDGLFAADASFVPHGHATKKLLRKAFPKPAGGKVRLVSHNFHDRSVRHQGFVYRITEVHSDLDKADADLRVTPALNGMPGAVSFTSKHFPGRYLRHRGFEVFLEPGDGSPVFAGDASFFVRRGLADPSHSISLESCNFPGRFIRHMAFVLRVDAHEAAPLFAADATFRPKGGIAKKLLATAAGRMYDDTSSSSDSSDSD